MRFLILLFLVLPIISEANPGYAFFESKIRPVLKAQCYRCHSNEDKKVKGGLLVDSQEALLQGGDSGPAIVPGNLEKSVLWKSISYTNDMEMPPKKQLPPEVLEDFKKWIEMGAPDPRQNKAVIVNTKVTKEDIIKGRSFWSFKTPKIYPQSKPQTTGWSKTAIDNYVLKELEKNKMTPAKDTDSSTILRRLFLDIVGLPPTPQQIKSFASNYRKDADKSIRSVVDYLLKRPEFGERWGRHWLDVARYAESNGKELNVTYPHAWRYRDYVIDSFNADKPYDQFLREQLAGDLLKASSDKQWSENLIATTFLALGPKNFSDNDRRQFRADLIDEQIDTVTRGIMGVSVACARCHDHKFEAIPQSDYYALAGIFLSSKTYYGDVSSRTRNNSSLINLPEQKVEKAGAVYSKAELEKMQQALATAKEKMSAARADARKMQAENERDQQTIRNVRSAQRTIAALEERIYSMNADGTKKAYCMGMQPGTPQNANILEKGEVGKPGQEIPRGFIQLIGGVKNTIRSTSNGRLEMAQWISSPTNPLTARVMVNRIWQKMLGEGIVRSTDDFGTTGEKPSHQALLDYLAVKFMKNKWSIKNIIREIANSRIYRASTHFNSAYFKEDPENKLLWRYNEKRLDAEVIRDSILQISGELDRNAPTASVIGSQPHTVIGAGASESLMTKIEEGLTLKYRSVYLPIARDALPTSLKVFDFPESMMTTSQREQNNTSRQSLYLMNNKFVIIHSDKMAKKIRQEFSRTDDQIKQVFLLCYGRYPTTSELQSARNLYNRFRYSKDLKGKQEDTKQFVALSSICQSLIASAEFRYQE